MHRLGNLRKHKLQFWAGKINIVRLPNDDMGQVRQLVQPSAKSLSLGIVTLGIQNRIKGYVEDPESVPAPVKQLSGLRPNSGQDDMVDVGGQKRVGLQSERKESLELCLGFDCDGVIE